MRQVITVKYSDYNPKGYKIIDPTSHGKDQYRALSPFFKSNIYCYGGLSSHNVENAWQYSKVYAKHDSNGQPSPEWYAWRDSGFKSSYANRYPMGRGVNPLYTWWNNIKYGYVEARKNIYIPIYERSVEKLEAFYSLQKEYEKGTMLAIKDFDVYRFDLDNLTLKDVLNDPTKKYGHGYVLLNMLTNEL